MSIILVEGIPIKWNLMHTVTNLAKTIRGQFEALNFGKSRGYTKGVYLRLSERLDPSLVVERICKAKVYGAGKLTATIPDHIPDIPLAAKPKRVPYKMCKMLKIAPEITPNMILKNTHIEILREMQCRYPGLYNLSNTTGHKLLDEIARTVFERLRQIMETNKNASESCFTLSKFYRKTHPHFGDFQLVLGTLHALQDAAGATRDHVSEQQLAALPATPLQTGNVPSDRIKLICKKYCDRIIKKVREHIDGLKSEITPGDSEEEIARKRVREELKKVAPHLPEIIRQLTGQHFAEDKAMGHKMRIYGEPFLPPKEQMSAFVKRYVRARSVRSDCMYNLLRATVQPHQYCALLAMDGTVYNGAKLLIRPASIPKYKVPAGLLEEMAAAFGGGAGAGAAPAQAGPGAAGDDGWGGDPADWAEEL